MNVHPHRSADAGRSSRRTVASLVAVLAAVVTLTLAGLGTGVATAAEATDGPTAAAWGAAWLDARLAEGTPLEPFGSPDWGTTLDATLSLAAVDGYEARTAAVWAAVEADREAAVTASGADLPGRLAQVVLLAIAIGEDPTTVGAGPGDDVVARLAATRTVGGADEGLYGSQDATWDGAYRQGLSMVALTAAGATPDVTAANWLIDQQCADGSWMAYRSDTSVACAFDAGLFVGPDSNSTAAGLNGLAAVGLGGGAEAAAGLAWLDGAQEDDGGWPLFPGDGSDPNSTAVVVQALAGLGLLDAPEFTDRSGTPLAALLGFQLGCVEGADAGSFTYPGTGGAPNVMASAQAVSGVAGAPLGITSPVVSGPFSDPCTTTTTSTPAPTTTSGDGGVGSGGSGRSGGSATPASLAFTGASSAVAGLGALLLLAGAGALLASRRVRGG